MKINSSNYTIHIGDEKLSCLQYQNYSQLAILVDENTEKYCLAKLITSNPDLKKAKVISLSSGEINKNLDSCQIVWKELSQNNFDRNSLLICLGGGVICDLGGFSASCFKRGIDFIHIPTTLLSMVDASVGGKTGVDFLTLKNQIGLFRNPSQVIICPSFLNTLNLRQIKSGFAEIVKHALIADKQYWKLLLEIDIEKINWLQIIYQSVQIKNKIVESDPLEKAERKQLNFGHTIGHAIESHYLESGIKVLHGEAVALGMIVEAKMSAITQEDCKQIEHFLRSNITLPKLPTFEEIEKWLIHDKKNTSGKIQFSLLTSIGKCQENISFNNQEIKKYF
jgi:3-dehydroquinate synthase